MSDHSHGPEAAYRRWGYAAEREQQRAGRAVRDMFPEASAPKALEDGDQRFTLEDTKIWALGKCGVERFDLDVAACQESHLAEKFYTKADDGLQKPWFGWVWCNPPFSDIEPWVERAWGVISNCHGIAQLLPASRTEQQWWQRLVEPYCDGKGDRQPGARLETHFLPGRTRFGLPGNPRGDGVGSPPFGCVLLIFRNHNPASSTF